MNHPVKPVLSVDWDGTCVEHVWPQEGDWLPGAVDALRYLSKFCTIYIYTCRIAPVMYRDWGTRLAAEAVADEKEYIRRMLDEAALSDIQIWEEDFKLPAFAYVDDKAVHYSGRSGAWKALIPKLLVMAGITDLDVVFQKEVYGS